MSKLKLNYYEIQMITYCKSERKNKNSESDSDITDFINYFKIYDLTEGTNHSLIIKDLYINPSEKFNLDNICYDAGLNERTLYRYRKKYVAVFEEITELKKNQMKEKQLSDKI